MNLIRRIQTLFFRNRQKIALEQLQWQSYLLHSGIPATAQVLDVTARQSEVPEYLLVNMWIRLSYQDNVSFQHTHTLLSKKMLPHKDQVIHIRFLPEDMSQVIVL